MLRTAAFLTQGLEIIMYKIDVRVLGMVGTNCYLLCNTDTKECVLIDPADNAGKISEMIEQSGCMLKGILLTHGHFDHIMGLSDVMEDIKVPVYVEEADLPMMMDGESNLSSGYMRGGYQFADAVPVRDGQQLQIAGFQFRVIHTPGHTPGGCCYYMEQEDVLFSGDTLFRTSVGRSDFPGGSASALVRSVKEKLLILPEETHVYPGQMEETTIGYEKRHNPFV